MKKERRNKIVILMLLITLFNYISPTISQADFGGKLFIPISELLTYVADLAMEGLHAYFLKEDLEDETKIKYSPALIFSNNIPSFDVNFFRPKDHKEIDQYDYTEIFKGTYGAGDRLIVEYEDFNNLNTGGYVEEDVYGPYLEELKYDTSYGEVDSFSSHMHLSNNTVEMMEELFAFEWTDNLKYRYYIPNEVMEDRHLKAFLEALFTAKLGRFDYTSGINQDYKSKSGISYHACSYIYADMRDGDNDFELITIRVDDITVNDPYHQFIINAIDTSGTATEIYNVKDYYQKDKSEEGSYEIITKDIKKFVDEDVYPKGYPVWEPKNNYDPEANLNRITNFFSDCILVHGLNPLYTDKIPLNTYDDSLFAFLTWAFGEDQTWTDTKRAVDDSTGKWTGYSFFIDGVPYKIEADYNEFTIYKGEVRKILSSTLALQPVVISWYKALRAIALVGLLSVLVYVGIRILISSTSQEKAKYKKMIGDWLAAIFMLFILHYLMIFILEIVNKITDVLSVSVIKDGQIDSVMQNVRLKLVGSNDVFKEEFPNLLIYLVLVIYTIMFTVQYMKRVIYMAFFTMIAPLIALTYPLDKIKDGQAQGFTTWLREYIFNALLQPMHLLLYYIFVTSASALVEHNWIYAIVAIGFLLPAEKFFRKMFGFEKAETSSQLGAAAGGALAMSVFSSIRGAGSKKRGGSDKKEETGGEEEESKDEGTRGEKSGEEEETGEEESEEEDSLGENSTPRYASNPEVVNPDEANLNQANLNEQDLNQVNSDEEELIFGQKVKLAVEKGTRNFKNGVKTLKGHYFNRGNGRKLLKGTGRLVRRGLVGAAGAATLGTIGLAAGIATGDASNAFKYGAAGATAGYIGANALGDKATEFEKKNREIYKEGALGTQEYNTVNSINELTNDNNFNNTCEQLGIENQEDREQLIRRFHSNGISNSEEIRSAVNIMAKNPGTTQEEIIAAQKINKEAKRYGMKKKDIEGSLREKELTEDEIEKAMNLIDKL